MRSAWWLSLAARALPFGLCAYAVVSQLILQWGGSLPRILLPAALLFGLVCAAMEQPHAAAVPRGSGLALPLLTGLLLAAGLGFLVYASVVTPDRSWDGLVSWSLRAAHMQPPFDLSLPFLGDDEVWTHSAHYPLLQPLCQGACLDLWGVSWGRLFFPLLFLALLLHLSDTLRRLGLSCTVSCLALLGCALAPVWYGRDAGSVSSGYAELLLAWLLSLAGAGLLLRDGRLLFCAGLLLPMGKPEGLVYLAALCAVAVCRTPGKGSAGLFWGSGLGMLVWFPLQAQLTFQDIAIFDYGAGVLWASGLLGLRALYLRLQPRPAWLFGILVLLLGAGLGFCVVFAEELRQSGNPLVAEFAARAGGLGGRLGQLPEICYGVVMGLADVNKFGLAFLLLLLLPWAPQDAVARLPRAAAWFLLANLLIAIAAMFLSPGAELEHQFRSRFDRLLLQQLPLLWLVLAPVLPLVVTRSR